MARLIVTLFLVACVFVAAVQANEDDASRQNAAADVKKVEKQLQALQAQVKGLKSAVDQHNHAADAHHDAPATISKLNDRLSSLEKDLAALKSTVESVHAETAKLTEQVNRLSSSSGSGESFGAWVSKQLTCVTTTFNEKVVPHASTIFQEVKTMSSSMCSAISTHTAGVCEFYKANVAPHLGNLPTLAAELKTNAVTFVVDSDTKLQSTLKTSGVPVEHVPLIAKVVVVACLAVVGILSLVILQKVLSLVFAILCCCRSGKKGKNTSSEADTPSNKPKKNKK